VTVVGRAAALSGVRYRYGGTLDALDADRFSIVVNAPSAGHGASGINPAAGKLARHLLVMDIVFVPTLTPLIREAQALGCETIDGTRMLVHQACGRSITGCARAPFRLRAAELKRSGG
jgi:shikimate dehydrogenase